MLQRVTTSGKTSDYKLQRVTASDNEWQRMATSDKTNEKKWE